MARVDDGQPLLASVVVATHDREARLRDLLAALEAQTLGTDRFEVVVVDDGSSDGTPGTLAAAEAGPLRLRTLRHEPAGGPGPARDAGWRAATAALIVFTDDDCVPAPEWLAELLQAARSVAGAVVMGRTLPEPGKRLTPFTHYVVVERAGPPYETCNILYPRALLERLDGFDLTLEGTFPGEDTDLGWRAEASGAPVAFASTAVVHHAVVNVGPLGKLRLATRWADAMGLFRRHPGLRRRQLHHGVFFAPAHEQLLLALLALALPRRLDPLRVALALPYARRLAWRRTGPLLAPYLLVYDLVEMTTIIRGAVRFRTFVL